MALRLAIFALTFVSLNAMMPPNQPTNPGPSATTGGVMTNNLGSGGQTMPQTTNPNTMGGATPQQNPYAPAYNPNPYNPNPNPNPYAYSQSTNYASVNPYASAPSYNMGYNPYRNMQPYSTSQMGWNQGMTNPMNPGMTNPMNPGMTNNMNPGMTNPMNPGMNSPHRHQQQQNQFSNYLPLLAMTGNDAAGQMAMMSALSGKGGQGGGLWPMLALGGHMGDTMTQALLFSNMAGGRGQGSGMGSMGGLPLWAMMGGEMNNYLPFILGGMGRQGQGGRGGMGHSQSQSQGFSPFSNPALMGMFLGGGF